VFLETSHSNWFFTLLILSGLGNIIIFGYYSCNNSLGVIGHFKLGRYMATLKKINKWWNWLKEKVCPFRVLTYSKTADWNTLPVAVLDTDKGHPHSSIWYRLQFEMGHSVSGGCYWFTVISSTYSQDQKAKYNPWRICTANLEQLVLAVVFKWQYVCSVCKSLGYFVTVSEESWDWNVYIYALQYMDISAVTVQVIFSCYRMNI